MIWSSSAKLRSHPYDIRYCKSNNIEGSWSTRFNYRRPLELRVKHQFLPANSQWWRGGIRRLLLLYLAPKSTLKSNKSKDKNHYFGLPYVTPNGSNPSLPKVITWRHYLLPHDLIIDCQATIPRTGYTRSTLLAKAIAEVKPHQFLRPVRCKTTVNEVECIVVGPYWFPAMTIGWHVYCVPTLFATLGRCQKLLSSHDRLDLITDCQSSYEWSRTSSYRYD